MPDLLQTIFVQKPILEGGVDLKAHLAQIEISLIQEALQNTNGVVSKAAKLLMLQRTTLIEKMRKYKLTKEGMQQ